MSNRSGFVGAVEDDGTVCVHEGGRRVRLRPRDAWQTGPNGATRMTVSELKHVTDAVLPPPIRVHFDDRDVVA